MKKLLSLILVLAMMLSCCLILSSCEDGISKDSVAKDPTTVISDSSSNTISDFFEDETGIYNVLSSESKKSALGLYFEGADFLSEDISRIDGTLYFDLENDKAAIEAKANYKGDDLSARLFLDKNGIIADSEAAFGKDKVYGIFFETFISKFQNSEFANMFNLDEDAKNEILDAVKEFKDAFKSVDGIDTDIEALEKKLNSVLNMTVSEKEIKIGDKNIACIAVNYEITNKTIKDAVNEIYEILIKEHDKDGEIKNNITESLNELDASAVIEITASTAISKSGKKLTNINFSGKITLKDIGFEGEYEEDFEEDIEEFAEASEENYIISIDINADFADTAITVSANVDDNGEKSSAALAINKASDKDGVTYTITATTKEDTTDLEIASAEFKFNKDGTFAATLKIADEFSGENAETVTIAGTYETTKTKASFEITSVKYGNTTHNFKLGIIFDNAPAIPETPSNVKDMIDLSKDDWGKFISDFRQSEIGKIIFGAGPDFEY